MSVTVADEGNRRIGDPSSDEVVQCAQGSSNELTDYALPIVRYQSMVWTFVKRNFGAFSITNWSPTTPQSYRLSYSRGDDILLCDAYLILQNFLLFLENVNGSIWFMEKKAIDVEVQWRSVLGVCKVVSLNIGNHWYIFFIGREEDMERRSDSILWRWRYHASNWWIVRRNIRMGQLERSWRWCCS